MDLYVHLNICPFRRIHLSEREFFSSGSSLRKRAIFDGFICPSKHMPLSSGSPIREGVESQEKTNIEVKIFYCLFFITKTILFHFSFTLNFFSYHNGQQPLQTLPGHADFYLTSAMKCGENPETDKYMNRMGFRVQ